MGALCRRLGRLERGQAVLAQAAAALAERRLQKLVKV
jgi:hypothetical protein